MIKQKYKNFQQDLKNGMTLTEALQKHNITLEDAFNTLHFSKPPEPTNEKRKTMRNVDFYIFKRKNSYTIRKHVDGKQRVFGTYEKLEDAIKVRDWLIRADWKIDDLDELCKKLKVKKEGRTMKIIERTEQEYLEDIEKQYEQEMKPLLDQGISMNEAFRRMGVCCGKGARKHRELRRIALERGYQLRR